MEKKSSETSKSIFKNVLYGFSTWFLPLGLSFIATPIIVKSLGNDDYGIYALVLGFIGYSFNLNIGRAITKYIAEYRANGETHKINDVISTTILINIVLGFCGALLIILLAEWLVTDVFLINAEAHNKTIYALYISAAIIFVTMLNQVSNSILQGLQRFDVYSKIFNANSFAILIGNILLALNGFGLVALLIWNLSVLFLIGIILFITSKKLLNDFRLSFKINSETLSLILKFSSGIILYQIISNFLLLFERGWIIRQLGEESLTFYVVPMLLGIYIHSFITSLLLVLFPLTSELNEEREKLKNIYLKATKLVCFLVFFLAVSLIVEGRLFLTLWMGNEFADKSWLLLVIHTIAFSLLALCVTPWTITEGLGYPFYNCFVFSICLIISVFFMIYLTKDYGNTGVAIGRLAGFSVLFLSTFYVEKWFFKEVQIKFWLKIIGLLGIATICGGLIESLIITNFKSDILTFLFATICGGLVYCIVLFILGFINDEDKKLIKHILKK